MFIVPVSRSAQGLVRNFDPLRDDSFDRLFASPLGQRPTRTPALDVVESDSAYTVKLDMPGATKEDLQVSIDGRVVTVRAESKREDETKDGERIVYRERALSRFARNVTLPTEVDSAQSNARLQDGVLTLTLPKRTPPTASRIAVS
jgi:HSP20 family protein